MGLSGGVDSSVTAALLKERGFDVVGVHLKCYNVDGCAEQDAEDARRAAEILKIPFYVFDYEQEYKDRVVKYMIDGYKAGITPNPDVMCNKEIKFGLFFDKAMELGADYVATGHYARIQKSKTCLPVGRVKNQKSYELRIAKDSTKDQSYFLWTLTQKQLAHCLFPVGELIKRTEVRKLAKKFSLENAEKKDSQGICFLGQVSIADFLKDYIKPKTGAVMNAAGEQIGAHSGAAFYTIGQRHGFDVRIRKQESGIKGDRKPHYVVSKDVKKNILVVAEGEENESLYKKEVELAAVNFISTITNNQLPMTVYARVRYRQPLAKAKLLRHSERSEESRYKLLFAAPQKFVAVGQSAVFYDKKGVMLGGGVIL